MRILTDSRLWFFYGLLSGLYLWWPALSPAADSRKIEKMIEDAQTQTDRAQMIRRREQREEQGRDLFRRHCIHCHGKNGKGDGDASFYLFPKPRDLESGVFKFHTTQANAPPADADLARTIREGLAGTAMPAWGGLLSDEEINALIVYLKTLSRRFSREIPDYQVEIGLEPPFEDPSVEKGKDLYRQLRCGRCHGERGERSGLLEDQLKDVWGHPSFVFDLARPELYKGGATGDALYNTLVVGIDGTSMNAYDYLNNTELWHLIHYLQSRFTSGEPQPYPPAAAGAAVTAARFSGPVPRDPDNPAWASAPARRVPLMPIQARLHPIRSVEVRALHNGDELAVRLEWEDPTPEGAARGAARFLDEAALQFPLPPRSGEAAGTPPFFGMGQRRRPVHIWHWKADSSQHIALKTAPPAGPKPAAVQPFLESPVEELNAQGFGALSVQTLEDQQLKAEGRWDKGRWRVVFWRPLKTPSPNDAQFAPGEELPMAVALWDGANRDKNANKVVSFWQRLRLE